MKVSKELEHKLSPKCVDVLHGLSHDSELIVIVTFKVIEERKEVPFIGFENRTEYRRNCIQIEQEKLEMELGDTFDALRDLGLVSLSCEPSRVIPIKIPVGKIESLLKLEMVQKVHSDERITCL